VQNADLVEVVERDRDRRVPAADPSLGVQKAGDPQPLRNMFGVVPIVKLVLGDIREIHRRDQDTLRHHVLPSPLSRR